MSRDFTQAEYERLRDKALEELKEYMDGLPSKQGAKLAYWISDYVRFLEKERNFDPQKLIRYKRGCIVKVHLGYRVGSEEGGLHYAVVMDVNNAMSSPTATIIPLTSAKPGVDLKRLHPSKLYLGDEIYKLLLGKCQSQLAAAINRINKVGQEMAAINEVMVDPQSPDAMDALAKKAEREAAVQAERDAISREIMYCQKMTNEIEKMKRGSIALVGQITTVSKIRIYDPLYPHDVLSNIRLSPSSMDKLDKKVRDMYTYIAPKE